MTAALGSQVALLAYAGAPWRFEADRQHAVGLRQLSHA
jgi:hypothetical protein